jgi:hypothetical protein
VVIAFKDFGQGWGILDVPGFDFYCSKTHEWSMVRVAVVSKFRILYQETPVIFIQRNFSK